MPTVMIRTNVSIPEDKKSVILTEATKIMVEVAHKKEAKVMILLETVDARMGNKNDPLAFAEVRSMVGLDHEMNHDISERLCDLLEKVLGISNERIYINFLKIPETAWGWQRGIAVWEHAERQWVIK
ncbi:MAG: phenylpyruvate tautomerase MIF-related protein [Thermodesulfobacteriota bacterium]